MAGWVVKKTALSVMAVPGLDPGIIPVIHVVKQIDVFRLAGNGAAWMAGTSPAMTERAVFFTIQRLNLAPMGTSPAMTEISV